MNIEQANAIPLTAILEKIGVKSVKEDRGILYYPSFIHTTPHRFSLAVHTHYNTWQDTGVFGRAIDFIVCYLKSCGVGHTPAQALRWLNNMFGYYLPPLPDNLPNYATEDAEFSFEYETYLSNGLLLEYIEQRGISYDVVRFQFKEIVAYHKGHKRNFHFIGLRNEEGGYYIRSPQAKANIGIKAITFIRGTDAKPTAVNVFADIWDYFSIITRQKDKVLKNDSIILNSSDCLKDAIAYIRNYGYETLFTWMENTDQGKAIDLFFLNFSKLEPGLECLPMNWIYKDHQGVNAWHIAKRKHRHPK